MADTEFILRHYETLSSDKMTLLPVYQTIGEFVRLRKQNFTVDSLPGAFLNAKELFDATAVNANSTMAAALMGNMWPNGAKSIRITKPDSILSGGTVEAYFKKISQIVTNAMDHPKARLSLALDEFENDLGAFGTCGIAVFENSSQDNPVSYKVWDVKSMVIDEDKNGVVDTIMNKFKLTVRQVVDEYGISNVSANTRKLYEGLKYTDKVEILHAIMPRNLADQRKGGKTNKGLPVGSYHIEVAAKKILKESGYNSVPVIVGRFYKVPGEKYGRSPAMQALPDIIELNAVRESKMLAIEKFLDPPVVVYDDGSLGAGEIDTSAGGVNVFSISGRVTNLDPIKPLHITGELQSTEKHIEQLMMNITQAFYIDRLLDLNNDTRMTLGEAQIRNRIRGDSLTSIFDRQEIEVLTPITDRTVKSLLDKGLLGVYSDSVERASAVLQGQEVLQIPPEVERLMKSNREWYKIQYISPAKRMQQAEEMQGIMTTMQIAGEVAQVDPTVLDWINKDVLFRRATELGGGPSELISDADTVAAVRNARAKAQEEAARQESERNQSEVARNIAQARATMNQVGAEAGV